MMMMFTIPSKKDGCDDNDASLVAISTINEMLKALMNKLPCRIGPWNIRNLAYEDPKEEDLLTILPEDTDFVESYVFDYNRSLALDTIRCVRLNMFYSDLISVLYIQLVVIQLKKSTIDSSKYSTPALLLLSISGVSSARLE